ncbi:hypothetical protein MIMGU_mgv1a0195702mg, partial [Erythranthe guttata]
MNYLKPMKLYQELLKSNELKRSRLLGLDVGRDTSDALEPKCP